MPRAKKGANGRFEKVSEVAQTAAVEETPKVADNDILGMVLDQLNELKAKQAQLEEANALLETELEETRRFNAAEVAKLAAKEVTDPFRPNALPPEADHSGLSGDRPGTLEETLQCLEALARDNGTAFDRERTRKILLGEPVEDLNKWTYNGHAFENEREMQVYMAMVEREKERTIGKYQR